VARILPVILLAAGLLAMAAPAEATVTGDWGWYAVTASHFRVPLPDAYVHRSPCPDQSGIDACASWDTPEIWLPDEPRTPSSLQVFALAHELGHRFDAQYLADPDREWLRRVMRAPGGDWLDDSGAGEWFADYYADCALDSLRHHISEEGYADRPSFRQLQRVCNAVWAWWRIRH
jgi:hypothetical protein